MDNAGAILLIIGLVFIIFVIRCVISALVNKGADAVKNAIDKRKSETTPSTVENLADRYKAAASDASQAAADTEQAAGQIAEEVKDKENL